MPYAPDQIPSGHQEIDFSSEVDPLPPGTIGIWVKVDTPGSVDIAGKDGVYVSVHFGIGTHLYPMQATKIKASGAGAAVTDPATTAVAMLQHAG